MRIPWLFLILAAAGLACVWAIAGARVPPGLHIGFLVIAVLAAALAVSLDALRLQVLVGIDGKELRFREAVRIVLIYAFFSAITATSLGGEASMAGILKLRGLSTGGAVAATGLRTLLSMISLLLAFPLLALARPVRFRGLLAAGVPAAAGLCGGLLVALAALVVRRRLLRGERMRQREAASYGPGRGGTISGAFRRLEGTAWDCWDVVSRAVRERPGLLLDAAVLTLAHLLALFSTAPLCAAALGIAAPFWKSVISVALVQLTTFVIPAPGGGGVSETGLGIAMKDLLPAEMVFPTVLLWRLVSSYSRVALGALLTIGVLREAAGATFRNAG